MQENGYPLHIDATSEFGKGGLFVCMDGFKKWVLCAGKIESESEEHLKPFVERTVELFGDPIATVRDLGKPGKHAVAPLAQRGIPDFVCHYHFLGVVGEKLFDNPNALLRNILKLNHIRSNLRQLLKDLKFYRGKDPKKGRFGHGRDPEDQPAQAALAANLFHPDYVRILCGSLDHLHNAFADLDQQTFDQATPLVRSNRDTALQNRVRILLKHLQEADDVHDEIAPHHAQINQ